MTNLEQKQNGWLEPMSEWIKVASSLEKTARDSNLFLKKVAAEQVFGSNLVLAGREARVSAPISPDSPPTKPMGGTLCRPPIRWSKIGKSNCGAGGENRTPDLRVTNAPLCQLSYSGSNGTSECTAPPSHKATAGKSAD